MRLFYGCEMGQDSVATFWTNDLVQKKIKVHVRAEHIDYAWL